MHIDTGFLGLSDGGLLSAVQDLFVTPLWMALVWAVHALVVMLEWCFDLDLVSSPAPAGLAAGLRRMEASFTGPGFRSPSRSRPRWRSITASCAAAWPRRSARWP